jgi:hypothetical protein
VKHQFLFMWQGKLAETNLLQLTINYIMVGRAESMSGKLFMLNFEMGTYR